MEDILYIKTPQDIRFKKSLDFNNSNRDTRDGYEYVDFDLPSRTLWAKMNVGAKSETDYGLYFAWGETTGYKQSQIGTGAGQKQFSWNDYKYGTSSSNITKYKNYNSTLELVDDAAAANMGGWWRMPTLEQMRELALSTTNGYVEADGTFTQYTWHQEAIYTQPSQITVSTGGKFGGVAGYLFFKTGVTLSDALSNGEYLFVPSAGTCGEGSVVEVGEYGGIWSKSIYSNKDTAGFLSFDNRTAQVAGYDRCNGLSVRGVWKMEKLS